MRSNNIAYSITRSFQSSNTVNTVTYCQVNDHHATRLFTCSAAAPVLSCYVAFVRQCQWHNITSNTVLVAIANIAIAVLRLGLAAAVVTQRRFISWCRIVVCNQLVKNVSSWHGSRAGRVSASLSLSWRPCPPACHFRRIELRQYSRVSRV